MLPFCLSKTLGCFQGFCAQPTGRIVDDALQPQIIRPVVDDTQVGKHILHFRTVKEPGTANNAVANSIALQGVFQCVGLGVGTVQNGKIPEALPPGSCQDLTGDIVAL